MLTFLDLETTGLDRTKEDILEVAMIVTDDDLVAVDAMNVIVRPVASAISRLGTMDPVVVRMHTDNGLLAEVEEFGIRRYEAEERLLTWIQAIDGTKGCNIAGDSVAFDLDFLRVHMPRLAAHFHYRVVDVSSFNEMARRWNKKLWQNRPRADKTSAHRAMPDAQNSLDTLQYYCGYGLFHISEVNSV